MLLRDEEVEFYGSEFVSGGFRYRGLTFEGYLAARTARDQEDFLRTLHRELLLNPTPEGRFSTERFRAAIERLRTVSVREITSKIND